MADSGCILKWDNGLPAAATPRSQRLLITADTLSGVWDYAIELCRALIASGHEVALATMGAMPDREQRRAVNAIAGLSLYPSAYRLLWMDDAWDDVDAASHWLLDVAAAVRPHVVHLNDFGHAALAWKSPVLLTAHSSVCSGWHAVHGTPLPACWRRYREHVAAALKAADLVVVPSHTGKRALQQQFGPTPARVIPHGHALACAQPRVKAQLVFAGSSRHDSGANLTLATAATRLDWPVCIADAGRQPDGELLVAGDACLLGRLTQRQTRGWLARAPIYAHPARHVDRPLDLLEAGLSRCALVLGDIDELRETWDGAALFVDPDDGDALSHALRSLIADEGERDYYAMRALVRARRYSASAMAQAYAKAYAELALREYGEAAHPAAPDGECQVGAPVALRAIVS